MGLMCFLVLFLAFHTNNCFCKSTFSNHADGHYEEHIPDGYKFPHNDRSFSYAKNDGGYKRKPHGCHHDELHKAEDRYGDGAGYQDSSSYDYTAMNYKDEHKPSGHFSTGHHSRSSPSDSRRYQKRSIQDGIDNLLLTKSDIVSAIRDIRDRRLDTTKAIITEIKHGIQRSFAQVLGKKLFNKSNALEKITRELVNIAALTDDAIRKFAQGVVDKLDVIGDAALAQSDPLNNTPEVDDRSDETNVIPEDTSEVDDRSDETNVIPEDDASEVDDLSDETNVIPEVMNTFPTE